MSIYKECDILGVYGCEFTSATAYKIGRAVAYLKDEKEVLVCGDNRPTTAEIKQKLVEGLVTGGVKVYDMGIAPISVFNFAKEHYGLPIGIMVTGGHEIPGINGFKLLYGSIPTREDEIQKIRSTIEKANFPFLNGSVKKLTDFKKEYLRDIFMKVRKGSLKIVADCKNSILSEYAPTILSALGHNIIKINCDTKGELAQNAFDFSLESLNSLRETVIAENANMGIAFSLDGGRIAFLDEKGDLVPSESIAVFLMTKYAKPENISVVYDKTASPIIKKEGEKLGITTFAEHNSYHNIRSKFVQEKSALAFQTSGHFFFGELGYDDSIFAAAKIAQLIDTSKMPLSEIIAKIN